MLGVLQAWTESLGHEARVRTCGEEGFDIGTDADVVAISVYTFMAPAAYRIAKKLRAGGRVVVLGGPHFHGPRTIDEARPHCDVVVETICRRQWEALLSDIAVGSIRPGTERARHVADENHEFEFPDNMHETYARIERRRFPLLMASLGCPFRCEFCNPFRPGKYELRDTDVVCRELASIKGRYAAFCDATFGLNKKHTIELMRKIAPLGKHLFVQTALGLLDDSELLDALAMGGVGWLSVGIESLTTPQKKHGKNSVDGFTDALKRIIDAVNDRGMLMQGNFICGIDGETEECFDHIYEFYRTSNLNGIIVDIMAPYPNTRLFEKLESEGRIIDYDGEHYDFHHVVYRPQNMSIERLVEKYTQLYLGITSYGFLLKKNMHILGMAGITAGWPMMVWNMMHHFEARRKDASLRASGVCDTLLPSMARS